MIPVVHEATISPSVKKSIFKKNHPGEWKGVFGFVRRAYDSFVANIWLTSALSEYFDFAIASFAKPVEDVVERVLGKVEN